MLCVLILYISGGYYSLKSTPNDIFFEKLYMTILFTHRVFDRNLLRGNRRRNTFRISFRCLAWNLNPGFSSNKPTHYLLHHGDLFITRLLNWPLTTILTDIGVCFLCAYARFLDFFLPKQTSSCSFARLPQILASNTRLAEAFSYIRTIWSSQSSRWMLTHCTMSMSLRNCSGYGNYRQFILDRRP